MIKVGKTYSSEDGEVAVRVYKITHECDEYFRVLGDVIYKEKPGSSEYCEVVITKAALKRNRLGEYE